METVGAGSNLTPEEARAALRAADAEELATRNRPVPVWYFPVLAALILAVFLLNSVENPGSTLRGVIVVLTVGIPLLIAALVGRVTLSQPGYHGVRVTQWPRTAVAIVVAAALSIAPVLWAGTIGSWIWIVCGIVLSGLIAGFGIAYWRRHSRG
jgi:hypothetical protein